ncbi:MAG: hypothetical protein IJ824_02955 [Alphaproteobacteria bacterium]|nr:hypothetical protein [Alphaproteobacteria bacterium]
MQALTLVPDNMKMPSQIVLFGGGWKNPIVRQSFENLLSGKGFILPEHTAKFAELCGRFAHFPTIKQSNFGDYMEARLFADLARYKLEGKAWEIPEVLQSGQKIVCGIIAKPNPQRKNYTDCINRAAKGWQFKLKKTSEYF